MFKIFNAFKVIILISILNCFSETGKDHNQTIFLELGGGGIFYSINYENLFAGNDIVRIGARFGFCILPSKGNMKYEDHLMFFIPLVLGSKASKLELNVGLIRCHAKFKESSDSYPIITPGIGYRYKKRGKRFNFRIGFCPLIVFDEPSYFYPDTESPYFLPSGYLSFGYSF
jgi:hypothetical protein